MYIYNLNILTNFLSMKMNKTHCYIVQILCSFFVDSVFEVKWNIELTLDNLFGSLLNLQYLGIIFNQREHRQLKRVKFSDI